MECGSQKTYPLTALADDHVHGPSGFRLAALRDDDVSTQEYVAMYHEELRQGRSRSEERLELMLDWEAIKKRYQFSSFNQYWRLIDSSWGWKGYSEMERKLEEVLLCKVKFELYSDRECGGTSTDSFWMLAFTGQQMLDNEIESIRLSLYDVLAAEGTVEEERKRQERENEERRVFNMYMQRLERLIRGIAIRLHAFFGVLFLFCKFAGFSDSDVPICTTMPWNIRPALIVLWGVCWMFFTPQEPASLSEVRQPIAQFDLPESDWLQWVNLDYLSSANTLDFMGNLDGVAEISRPDLNLNDQLDFLSAYHFAEPVTCLDDEVLAEGWDQRTDGSVRASTAKEGLTHPGPSLATQASQIWRLNQNSPQHVISLARPCTPSNSESVAETSRIAQSRFQFSVPQGTDQQQVVLSNQPGQICCEHAGCSELRFSSTSDLKKHDDRNHNRYACTTIDCGKTFGSKGDLKRHEQTKHDGLPAYKLLRCQQQGCKFAGIPHFKRKDNLVEHLRRMHNFEHVDAKAAADSEAKAQSQARHTAQVEQESATPSESELNMQIATIPVPSSAAVAVAYDQTHLRHSTPVLIDSPSRKRRRCGESPPQTEPLPIHESAFEELPGNIDTWRRKAAKLEADIAVLQAENASLRTSNDILKGDNERLKRNEDSLISILAHSRNA